MNIENKLMKIIPPDDYQHRWEFSNRHLIDELNDEEKEEVENALITKLDANPGDILMIETLAYMHSTKAIPAIENSLESCKINVQRIIIAISIYEIDQNMKMIGIAIDAFKQVHEKWDLVTVFSYLKGFNDSRIDEMIKKYISHPDYLVSYNAKRALGINS